MLFSTISSPPTTLKDQAYLHLTLQSLFSVDSSDARDQHVTQA
jgi:hypothetical protein